MFEELLTQQNPHWAAEEYDGTSVPRSCFGRLLDYLDTGQVVAVTGVRRTGKSTLVRQLIDHLIGEVGVSPSQILFLNLEHPYLSAHREDPATLERIFESYLKLMKPKGEIFVFLDEVQFFKDWPLFVKSHHETKKVRFVVTGSNAAMISSDMVTLLSGRSLPIEVFPFSMRELAVAKETPHNNSPELRSLLDELLETGSYPLVALGEQKHLAFEILGAHARTVLLQDVAPRIGARKPEGLEKLYVYLVSNLGKPFSYTNLSKLFSLSDKSVKEYLTALADAHLIYEVDLFSYSLKKQMRNPKMVYAIDTGQANAMGFRFTANKGRLLENLLFVDLKRLGLDVYYYRTARDREIDFVIKQGNKLTLVQVAWQINDQETREREMRALKEAMEELDCARGVIVVAEPPPSRMELDVPCLQAHELLVLPPDERLRTLLG